MAKNTTRWKESFIVDLIAPNWTNRMACECGSFMSALLWRKGTFPSQQRDQYFGRLTNVNLRIEVRFEVFFYVCKKGIQTAQCCMVISFVAFEQEHTQA